LSNLLKSGQFSLAELKRLGYGSFARTGAPGAAVEETQELSVDSLRQEALRQGYQEGFEAGYQDGIAKAEATMAGIQELLKEAEAKAQALVAQAQEDASRVLQDVRPVVLDLGLEIARRIMRREVTECPEVLLSIAQAALEKVKAEESVTLRVNPRDVVVVSEGKSSLLEGSPGIKSLRILEDDTVEPGGCIVEGTRGRVDATLEGQLAMAREALKEVGQDG